MVADKLQLFFWVVVVLIFLWANSEGRPPPRYIRVFVMSGSWLLTALAITAAVMLVVYLFFLWKDRYPMD